jgi:TonB family protein
MSAAATQAPVRGVTNTRRVPRVPLAVPADVTVLRSGIPYSIPGRSVSIGERGLGVVLAGELHAGDSVGLEFRLPDTGGRLRLKAVVRYQALLHCGLEFLNLTAEQQTLIEHWTRKKSATNPRVASPVASAQSAALPIVTAAVPLVEAPPRKSHSAILRPALLMVLAGVLLLGGLGWWHWYRAWSELEAQIPGSKPLLQQPPATVPAEVMEGLVTHKVEPIYPDAARQANIQGVVVLDAVIGADGTVVDVRPISGPDELTPAAVDAVKWWRFQPYLVNGQAVRVKTTLALDFRGN